MLEKMDSFFNDRIVGYEEHQLNEISGAREFYPFTASCLPVGSVKILDLGCGTGLELNYYFEISPAAEVVCIDLAAEMLKTLKSKFCDKRVEIICGSYFDVPFGKNIYDAVVSVESLHHFTQSEKVFLYRKIYNCLKRSGYFLLTDYFAASEYDERKYREELIKLKAEQEINDDDFYHYDTPLTVGHEIQALREAGFSSVEILDRWETTCTIKACI